MAVLMAVSSNLLENSLFSTTYWGIPISIFPAPAATPPHQPQKSTNSKTNTLWMLRVVRLFAGGVLFLLFGSGRAVYSLTGWPGFQLQSATAKKDLKQKQNKTPVPVLKKR